MTVNDVVNEIKKFFLSFTPNDKVQKNMCSNIESVNRAILRYRHLIPNICKKYKSFVDDGIIGEEKCNEVLNEIIIDEGILFETIAVYWISKTSLGDFIKLHVELSEDDIIGANPVEIDGELCEKYLFDVKTFSPYEDVIRDKFLKLQQKHPNYVFMTTGKSDLSAKELYNKSVETEANDIDIKNKNQGILHLPNDGKILMKKKELINISESVFSPFVWCENNYDLFINHCHQFSTKEPFILVEVFDEKKIHSNSEISTYMLLRTMIRRTFFQLSESTIKASDYDDKVKDHSITAGTVVSYLSAVMFIDANTGRAYAFVNPLAKNKIKHSFFDKYNWDNKITIDDFNNDNY